MNDRSDAGQARTLDAIIVGAGFAGLYMLYRLRAMGLRCVVYEAGDGVGGTWYWNRYPGARCDIESIEYSYSFSKELEQEWDWSERYAAQPEILSYANHVAERFDLFRDIKFNTRVTSAIYGEEECQWTVITGNGMTEKAQFCIMATGCLSSTKLPEINGVDSFRGPKYHTGQWPHQPVNFTGKRVGIIGTGSSGIQAITELAKQAGHLYVFQRTPHYSLPAFNRPLTQDDLRTARSHYGAIRAAARRSTSGIAGNPIPTHSALEVQAEERERAYSQHWFAGRNSIVRAYTDLLVEERANETAADFVRNKIQETVKSPEVAQALKPRHFIGTKRICLDTGYYESFNRSNVELVDLERTPIKTVTATGVSTSATHIELDALVFATGYDAVTGALAQINVTTRSGHSLSRKWAAGPKCYLGLMTAGFPNLFIITGPGSPSILSNVILSIEHHVDMIADCVEYMQQNDLRAVDADGHAEDDWANHVSELAAATLYPRADSWYMGANVPGKPRVFLPYVGGVSRYQKTCLEIVNDGWRGFSFYSFRSGDKGVS